MTVKLVSHLLVVLLPVDDYNNSIRNKFHYDILELTDEKHKINYTLVDVNTPTDEDEEESLKISIDEKLPFIMIKVGTNVKSKIHDDLTGHVVICEPINNYAVIMTDIIDYEMMTVECFLSDLEVA